MAVFKVLFQIALAIMKMNGDAILRVKDDGELMNVLKHYFTSLNQLVTSNDSGSSTKTISKFNELMLTAYREFQTVTHENVLELRKARQLKVVHDIDTYAKRSVVRNLNVATKFKKEELLYLCDQFFSVHYYGRRAMAGKAVATAAEASAIQKDRVSGDSKTHTDRLDLDQFKSFISRIVGWGDIGKDIDEQQKKMGLDAPIKPVVGSGLLDKLFHQLFDRNKDGFVDFPDIVVGLGKLIHNDMMSLMGLFFDVHDEDHDSQLTKEEVLQLSESLLFLMRREEGERHLNAVSNLLTRAFQYQNAVSKSSPSPEPGSSRPDLSMNDGNINNGGGGGDGEGKEDSVSLADESKKSVNTDTQESATVSDDQKPSARFNQADWKIALPAFRELVLFDDYLVEFFESTLPNSFELKENVKTVERTTVGRDVAESIWTEGLRWTGWSSSKTTKETAAVKKPAAVAPFKPSNTATKPSSHVNGSTVTTTTSAIAANTASAPTSTATHAASTAHPSGTNDELKSDVSTDVTSSSISESISKIELVDAEEAATEAEADDDEEEETNDAMMEEGKKKSERGGLLMISHTFSPCFSQSRCCCEKPKAWKSYSKFFYSSLDLP